MYCTESPVQYKESCTEQCTDSRVDYSLNSLFQRATDANSLIYSHFFLTNGVRDNAESTISAILDSDEFLSMKKNIVARK